MFKAINTLASIALTLALAVWVGAMAGFAFLYAPATFRAMGPTTAFAALIASQIEALSLLGHLCAIVIVSACVVLAARAQRRTRWVAVATIAIVMALLVLLEVRWLLPQMRETALETAAYAALHQRSATIYGVTLLLGILALAVTAWRGDAD